MSFKRDADAGAPAGSSRSRGGNGSFLLLLCTVTGLLNTLLLLLLLFRGQPPLSGVEPKENPGTVEVGDTIASTAAMVLDSVGAVPDSLDSDLEEPAVTAAEPASPPPALVRSRIRIQVINATTVPKLAARTGDNLTRKGYDVRETGNSPKEKGGLTRVYSRVRDTAAALQVASDLGLGTERVSEKPDPDLVDVDVTVVIGTDYRSIGALGAGN
jgi:hypothetical protein